MCYEAWKRVAFRYKLGKKEVILSDGTSMELSCYRKKWLKNIFEFKATNNFIFRLHILLCCDVRGIYTWQIYSIEGYKRLKSSKKRFGIFKNSERWSHPLPTPFWYAVRTTTGSTLPVASAPPVIFSTTNNRANPAYLF